MDCVSWLPKMSVILDNQALRTGKLQRRTQGGSLVVQFEVQDSRNPQLISKSVFETSDYDAFHFCHTTEFDISI